MSAADNLDADVFAWTGFYQAFADKLLGWRNSRADLIVRLRDLSTRIEGLAYLGGDQFPNGTSGFLEDICPFTTIGIFNRRMTDANRTVIAAALGDLLTVDQVVPKTFAGVPLLDPRKSWFFPFAKARDPRQIDALWDVFAAAINYADHGTEDSRAEFSKAFDAISGRPMVGWNLTLGLYWTRPWKLLSLDGFSRNFIAKSLGISIGLHGPERRCNAADYLAVMDALASKFGETDCRICSYPQLSIEAWDWKPAPAGPPPFRDPRPEEDTESKDPGRNGDYPNPRLPYAVDDIISEGCFLDREHIEGLIERLQAKKNLILQGPPGTGKTWLAKRLAFALIGRKDDTRVRSVQFHPNLSYEDFVRGWRPTGEGKLSLADGIFIESINAALEDPESDFVVVIEEINRGNPAQIFGELLTLLESDKRTPDEALRLCYPDPDGIRRPVYIPANLYVIGTMNIADRSLALVDLALRRRFAFAGLEPRLGAVWRDWVVNERNVDPQLAADIERRINALNDEIAGDPRLGKQFRIGHSFVTPTYWLPADGTGQWFRQVVETEIGPLLAEYWFDAPEVAEDARRRLLQGW